VIDQTHISANENSGDQVQELQGQCTSASNREFVALAELFFFFFKGDGTGHGHISLTHFIPAYLL
jgi:hypothetical protein